MHNFGAIKEGTKYKVLITEKARQEIKSLDKEVSKRVYLKLIWLSDNAEVIVHHILSSVPDDLKGLCKMRVGDWRILYWVYHDIRTIKIYGIVHQSKVYKKI